jgi:DNA uptake protein ComE-like DNA-binding protein
VILAALALVGCSPEFRSAGEDGGDDLLGRVLEEGTPDALGVAAMLNHPSTTVAVLDIDAKLDARAAKNLVAHRDVDPFDSVAEIDAVAYVGDAALQALVDYARAEGWVAEDDELYGVVEGVELTKTEAAAAVFAANTATYEELDVDLDKRAATALVANRPFDTVEAVAGQSYVGAAAIEDLVAWGLANGAAAGPDAAAVLAELDVVVDGLWFLSESDYPLDPFVLPVSGPVALADVKTVIAPIWTVPHAGEVGLADRKVEASDLGWVFDRMTVEQDWWEDEQRQDAARWQAVRDVFEQDLADVQVFRVGRTNSRGTILVGAIDIYVWGTSSDGQLVGLHTVSVET